MYIKGSFQGVASVFIMPLVSSSRSMTAWYTPWIMLGLLVGLAAALMQEDATPVSNNDTVVDEDTLGPLDSSFLVDGPCEDDGAGEEAPCQQLLEDDDGAGLQEEEALVPGGPEEPQP